MKHLFNVSGYGFDGSIDQFHRINGSDSIIVFENLLDEEKFVN